MMKWLAGTMLLALGAESSPEPLTLAGIHLRDTPAQARAVLLQTGYRIVRIRESNTYRQRMLDTRATQLRLPMPTTRSVDISAMDAVLADQRITVSFGENANGERVVVHVSYVAANLAHPYDRVLASLIERQGPPTIRRPQSTTWCVEAGDDCEAGGTPKTDMLAVRASNEGFGRNVTTIQLQIGESTTKAWASAHEAELRQLVRSKDAF